jgi:putative FmdB family regulatory protein
MPTYDYRCSACRHEFELFQSMKDPAKRKCPACGKNALERLIGTGAAILFKGSGFYETDYRSESYRKAAEADRAPAPEAKADSHKPESKAGPKPDSTPEATPAPKPDSGTSSASNAPDSAKRGRPRGGQTAPAKPASTKPASPRHGSAKAGPAKPPARRTPKRG